MKSFITIGIALFVFGGSAQAAKIDGNKAHHVLVVLKLAGIKAKKISNDDQSQFVLGPLNVKGKASWNGYLDPENESFLVSTFSCTLHSSTVNDAKAKVVYETFENMAGSDPGMGSRGQGHRFIMHSRS